MKILLLIICFVSFSAYSATCTTTSRNNYVTNQVLRSSDLNTDFNQLVTKANAFDGGCVTDGSLEFSSLNTTDFAVLLKAAKEGCKVSYSSATQVSISKCFAAVNGALVSKSTATTAAFGCTNCSAEVASTIYYVYIATGSSGSTLTPLILTTAPNEDGYDNSGNKVLGRFYNNASSDIETRSIVQWNVNGFIDPYALAGESYFAGTASCTGWTRTSTTAGAFATDADCPGPTVVYASKGDWLTTDSDLPRQTVNSLPAGVYTATFIVKQTQGGGGTSALSINDGTTTCYSIAQSSSASFSVGVITCTFIYAAAGNRVFELYGSSTTAALTIDNVNTSPVATGVKFILEYKGPN